MTHFCDLSKGANPYLSSTTALRAIFFGSFKENLQLYMYEMGVPILKENTGLFGRNSENHASSKMAQLSRTFLYKLQTVVTGLMAHKTNKQNKTC